ncbi:MAG TPA: hypothetical protein PLF61_08085, partial [Candidatus Goldiibacteriota bacterium]|nr:hypothetical protein [Candidatus Goldiibacteriota bacterium]
MAGKRVESIQKSSFNCRIASSTSTIMIATALLNLSFSSQLHDWYCMSLRALAKQSGFYFTKIPLCPPFLNEKEKDKSPSFPLFQRGMIIKVNSPLWK